MRGSVKGRRKGRHTRAAQIWNPPGLETYLLKLQDEYRLPEFPIPRMTELGVSRYSTALREEAERNIFNADHLIHLLVGHRGPWTLPKLPLRNLPFMLNQLECIRSLLKEREAWHPSLYNRERRVHSVMNRVRSMQFLSEGTRRQVLALLQAEKPRLYDGRFRQLEKLGITVHPSRRISKQNFWTPIVLQVVEYLRRTTKESDTQLFRMTSRILHLASERRYPDRWELVKRRWYDGMGLTKQAHVDLEWKAGSRVWKRGETVSTPEGLRVPVLGIEPGGLLHAFVLFVAAVSAHDAVLIQTAAAICLRGTLFIKVAGRTHRTPRISWPVSSKPPATHRVKLPGHVERAHFIPSDPPEELLDLIEVRIGRP